MDVYNSDSRGRLCGVPSVVLLYLCIDIIYSMGGRPIGKAARMEGDTMKHRGVKRTAALVLALALVLPAAWATAGEPAKAVFYVH